MDNHISEFFCQFSDDSPHGNFHRVIALHDTADVSWESISQMVPNLPKGWYELSQLTSTDRIEFTRDFWISRIPYHPHLDNFFGGKFFYILDNIGIYITQKKYDDPCEVHMVYSISENRGYYRGAIPATEEEIIDLQRQFADYVLPEDYLAFLQIHNGFWKTTDCTGLTCSSKMKENYGRFQGMLDAQGIPKTTSGEPVNPHSLIPFYESFGMPFFQCFWGEWHPENEMGNVYYSGSTNTISDTGKTPGTSPEEMAFQSFTDWLMFYLEQIG